MGNAVGLPWNNVIFTTTISSLMFSSGGQQQKSTRVGQKIQLILPSPGMSGYVTRAFLPGKQPWASALMKQQPLWLVGRWAFSLKSSCGLFGQGVPLNFVSAYGSGGITTMWWFCHLWVTICCLQPWTILRGEFVDLFPCFKGRLKRKTKLLLDNTENSILNVGLGQWIRPGPIICPSFWSMPW